VNAAAHVAVQTRFTALLHHIDVEALERAFRRQKRQASAGVDGMTVADYEQNLEANLRDLCARVHTGRYRLQPVRRVYIPKADGGRRPLGVPALEDKIVQGAVAETLSAIYEVDFLGFSYGFRPRRNPHQALASLHTAIMSQRVNWVLDADIRSFFDSVDHECCCECWRTGSPILASSGLSGCGSRPVSLRAMSGTRRTGEAARSGHQPAAGQHLPALRPRSLGPSMAPPECTRSGLDRSLRRRLRHGLRAHGRCWRTSRSDWPSSACCYTRTRRA
jgi:hypothetical protein